MADIAGYIYHLGCGHIDAQPGPPPAAMFWCTICGDTRHIAAAEPVHLAEQSRNSAGAP